MTAREVFVSYSQRDHEIAFGIVEYVERAGILCWLAPRDLDPGTDWAAGIIDAIAAARVMVLVFSASANASAQVRREVERAVNRGVPVLPFRIEDVMPARSLEYFLSSQHWLDAFPPPMEPHYARLSKSLHAALAAAPRESGQLPEVSPEASAPVPQASAATLDRLETELARYIGPVARLLVQRAALRTADIDALIVQLGTEIKSESERRRFLTASRQAVRGGPR